jgi:hydroxyacylglutathione hydrolase
MGARAVSFGCMQLEDHVGDVLAKARAGKGLASSVVAGAAGLSEVRYEELEREGRWSGEVNFRALGGCLGLGGDRLEGLASGWTPQRRDLGLWRELRCLTTERGMAVNCYLAWDEVTREAALFDTGWDAEPVFALVDGNGLQLRHLFITHGHVDHVAAFAQVRERFPKVKVHRSAADTPVDQRNRANDFIHLGSLRITNRPTPGHAEDGVTYVIGNWPEDAPGVAVVGDAVFAGSMGGAAGRFDEARRAVREQVLSLPPDTLICPGHGPVTTVGEERLHNPFFG